MNTNKTNLPDGRQVRRIPPRKHSGCYSFHSCDSCLSVIFLAAIISVAFITCSERSESTHYLFSDVPTGQAPYGIPLGIKIIDIGNKVFEGDSIRFEDNKVTCFSGGITPTSLTYDNIAGISFYSPLTTTQLKTQDYCFKVTFVNQDILYGTISNTGMNSISINNYLIGKVEVNLEQLSVIERVDDKASSSLLIKELISQTGKEDNIFLMSGDMDSGVINSFNPEVITLKSSLYNKERAYKINEIKSISFFSSTTPYGASISGAVPSGTPGKNKVISPTFPAQQGAAFGEPRPSGREARPHRGWQTVVYLVDNSQLRGSTLQMVDKTQVVLSTGKTGYYIPLEAIDFIYFRNGRCVYLSDLEPIEVKEYISGADPVRSDTTKRNKINETPQNITTDASNGAGDSDNTFLWHYQKDRSIFSLRDKSGQPISLQGKKHFKGLSVHANCELRYKLDNSYQRFFATIGFDDESPASQTSGLEGSVKFIVYLDGQKAYESDIFKRTTKPTDISLGVRGVKEIRLVVNDGGDGYILDRAAWASARLTK